MYSVGDIRTLNVLRELRSIGFPMKDIKAHLKDFNVQQTLDMFAEAIERIDRRQEELELLKKNVSERIDEINYYLREKKHTREHFRAVAARTPHPQTQRKSAT